MKDFCPLSPTTATDQSNPDSTLAARAGWLPRHGCGKPVLSEFSSIHVTSVQFMRPAVS
jgi:hypothetical protein